MNYPGLALNRLLVVDGEAADRYVYRTLFRAHPDLRVAAEAATTAETMALLRNARFDIVVMDLMLPQVDSGLRLLEHIARSFSDLPVLVLSRLGELEFLADALEAGAKGYLAKGSPDEEIVTAVRDVLQGKGYVHWELVAHLFHTLKQERVPMRVCADVVFSPREKEVLALLARGASNVEICKVLGLAKTTVQTCVMRVRHKLAARDRDDLVRKAARLVPA